MYKKIILVLDHTLDRLVKRVDNNLDVEPEAFKKVLDEWIDSNHHFIRTGFGYGIKKGPNTGKSFLVPLPFTTEDMVFVEDRY